MSRYDMDGYLRRVPRSVLVVLESSGDLSRQVLLLLIAAHRLSPWALHSGTLQRTALPWPNLIHCRLLGSSIRLLLGSSTAVLAILHS